MIEEESMASVREVKQKLDEAGAEAVDAAKEDVEHLRGELHRLREKLRANGARLEDELRDAGARLAGGAKQFGAAAAEQIREHPLAAFGIAFAAGIVISRLLRSR
jgi:ElaB/YqjD/DUF883 family membrane-anchored ribosome-binding protein